MRCRRCICSLCQQSHSRLLQWGAAASGSASHRAARARSSIDCVVKQGPLAARWEALSLCKCRVTCCTCALICGQPAIRLSGQGDKKASLRGQGQYISDAFFAPAAARGRRVGTRARALAAMRADSAHVAAVCLRTRACLPPQESIQPDAATTTPPVLQISRTIIAHLPGGSRRRPARIRLPLPRAIHIRIARRSRTKRCRAPVLAGIFKLTRRRREFVF